jgi:ETC complex I subunit conserved region
MFTRRLLLSNPLLSSSSVVRCSNISIEGWATTGSTSNSVKLFSSKAVALPKGGFEDSATISEEKSISDKVAEIKKIDKHVVYRGIDLPEPILPENRFEIATLDTSDLGSIFRTKPDGELRTVIIRQQKKKIRQSPLNREKVWTIYFNEDGMAADETWENSLMGWTSNGDPYQSTGALNFENATDAVAFAKKRGWQYIVKKPILRQVRSDDAQYQDLFLPQDIARRVQIEGTQCDHWARTSSGASHYFRPLKYHGNGLVRQHGPDQQAPIVSHVPGEYKIR